MRRRLPPLNSLAAFEAAARNRGFTRAAEELSVAQPAVTRHVANLEAWCGMALFTRRGNQLSITREGETLAEAATAALDRLEVAFGQLTRATRTEVLIGASFGMSHMWLMPKISGLRGAAQGVAINFMTSEDYRDFDGLEVDLSIRFGHGDWPGFHADLLFREDSAAIAAPSFLAAHPKLDPDDLADTLSPDWLLHHGDPFGAGWITWPLWFAHLGRPAPEFNARPTVRNFPALLEMVKAGEGVAIGTAGLDDQAVASGEVLRLGPAIRRDGFGYYLVYKSDVLERPSARAIRDHLLGSALASC